jgi:hemimethylated DNA binding protein
MAGLLVGVAQSSALFTPRCSPPVLLAGDKRLSTVVPWSALADLEPMNIVQAQLASLQDGNVADCYHLASPGFRRAAGSVENFEQTVRENPEYRPLVKCRRYQVLSTLKVGPRRWRCRVRVENIVGCIPFSAEYHWDIIQQSKTKVAYDLGQCVMQKMDVPRKGVVAGHRGVVVGWDSECRQSDEWCRTMRVDELPKGRAQPFYAVLVDTRDRPGMPQIQYVAQERLKGIDLQLIEHPYFVFGDGGLPGQRHYVFTGQSDKEKGTWEPSQRLREQYPLDMEGRWLVSRFFLDTKFGEPSGFDI